MFAELYPAQKSFFQSQQTRAIDFRLQKLKALRKSILQHEQEIKDALHADFRKPEFETLTSEIAVVIDELNLHIKKLKSWGRPRRVMSSVVNFPSSARIYPEPYGNVLIISPWNYPFNLAMMPLIGAVSAGNTVVLKPSEYSPATSQVIQKIVEEVFTPEHVSVVQGGISEAQELLKLPWNYIFFTGSTVVGKYVYKAAAEHLTPVTLELGGKSPVIVDKTADLPLAAKRLVWAKFLNAGQTCIAPDYILIDEQVSERFIELLRKEIIQTYGADAKQSPYYPRIINKKNLRRLENSLKGQNIVYGGQIDAEDLYVAPSIVLNPSLDSDLMQYEIFGPVLPVISCKNRDEMEQIIQQHSHPLAFYIFSNDKKTQQYFIDKYSFGGGVINDAIVHFINHRLPFGGVGKSGIGRYHGRYSFDTFSHYKPVVKRATWLDLPFRYLPPTSLKEKVIRFFLMR